MGPGDVVVQTYSLGDKYQFNLSELKRDVSKLESDLESANNKLQLDIKYNSQKLELVRTKYEDLAKFCKSSFYIIITFAIFILIGSIVRFIQQEYFDVCMLISSLFAILALGIVLRYIQKSTDVLLETWGIIDRKQNIKKRKSSRR